MPLAVEFVPHATDKLPLAVPVPQVSPAADAGARLMDAGVRIFARDGFEAASVNEIACAADVVNGTFHLHFKDKHEIAAVVAFRIAADVAHQFERAMEGIDDAAERASCGTPRFVELASAQPEWG